MRRLYHRYERRLYGFGLRLLGEPGLAEELVQETWVRLWQSAPRFDPDRGTVRAFLFTIARRVAVDLYRRPSSRALGAEQRTPAPSRPPPTRCCWPSPSATRWSRCRPPTARCSSWSTTRTSSWPTSPSALDVPLGHGQDARAPRAARAAAARSRSGGGMAELRRAHRAGPARGAALRRAGGSRASACSRRSIAPRRRRRPWLDRPARPGRGGGRGGRGRTQSAARASATSFAAAGRRSAPPSRPRASAAR